VLQTNTFRPTLTEYLSGDFLIRPEKIYGKKVITYKGLLMGEVDGIQMDENNWTIAQVDVALTKEMENLFDIKSGMMSKSIVPLPVEIMVPVTDANITLKQTIEDPKQLVEQVSKHRQKLLRH